MKLAIRISSAVLVAAISLLLFQNCGPMGQDVLFDGEELQSLSEDNQDMPDVAAPEEYYYHEDFEPAPETPPTSHTPRCPTGGGINICYSSAEGISQAAALVHCKQNRALNPRTAITCYYDGAVIFKATGSQ